MRQCARGTPWPRPSAGDLGLNTEEGVESVHDKLYAGDGRHGQLLIVLAPEGAKVGDTVENLTT